MKIRLCLHIQFKKVLNDLKRIFYILRENIHNVQFQIDASYVNLVPTLDAIDEEMTNAEDQNHFEIIRLQAETKNVSFLA